MRAGDEVSKEVLTRAGRYKAVRENLRVKGGHHRRRRAPPPVRGLPQPDGSRPASRSIASGSSNCCRRSWPRSRRPPPESRTPKRTCELLTSERFGRYLRQTKGGELRVDRAAVDDEARYDGKWVVTLQRRHAHARGSGARLQAIDAGRRMLADR
jgi:hypothetical protein